MKKSIVSAPVAGIDIHGESQRAWLQYQGFLAKDTRGLALSSRRYFEERSSGLPLAAALPIALAEPCGIDDPQVRQDVALICLCFDHSAQLLDDATDKKGGILIPDLHLQNRLLMLGLQRCAKLADQFRSGESEAFITAVHSQIETSMQAERSIRLRQEEGQILHKHGFSILAQRCSYLQIPLVLYGHIGSGFSNFRQLSEGINQAALGIQLLDDLYDWESDLQEGTLTHLLSMIRQHIATQGGNTDNVEEVASCLIDAGIAEEMLAVVVSSFKLSRTHFGECQAAGLVRMLDDGLSHAGKLVSAIAESRLRQPTDKKSIREIFRMIPPVCAH